MGGSQRCPMTARSSQPVDRCQAPPTNRFCKLVRLPRMVQKKTYLRFLVGMPLRVLKPSRERRRSQHVPTLQPTSPGLPLGVPSSVCALGVQEKTKTSTQPIQSVLSRSHASPLVDAKQPEALKLCGARKQTSCGRSAWASGRRCLFGRRGSVGRQRP